MDQVAFMDWLLLVDREATRQYYERFEHGDAERCGCDPCANFAANRRRAYPDDVHRLLRGLAIPYDREIEAPHIAQMAPNVHWYHGWFYFAGQIEQGPDSVVPAGPDSWRHTRTQVTDSFRIGFTKHLAWLPRDLSESDWVQLEFETELPLPPIEEIRWAQALAPCTGSTRRRARAREARFRS